MYIIREPASLKKIWEEREVDLGSMIKIVVDVNRRVLAIDAQLHADEEQRLLEDGSKQEDVWGANIHPFQRGDDRIEYTSLINIRPSQQNMGMEVQDMLIRQLIQDIIHELIVWDLE